jgi:uncharacterized membrane protein
LQSLFHNSSQICHISVDHSQQQYSKKTRDRLLQLLARTDVLTLLQCAKVIAVAVATSVDEISAAVGFFVEEPFGKISFTIAGYFRLVTNAFAMGLAVFQRIEIIMVAVATSIRETGTAFSRSVEVETFNTCSTTTYHLGLLTPFVLGVN